MCIERNRYVCFPFLISVPISCLLVGFNRYNDRAILGKHSRVFFFYSTKCHSQPFPFVCLVQTKDPQQALKMTSQKIINNTKNILLFSTQYKKYRSHS